MQKTNWGKYISRWDDFCFLVETLEKQLPELTKGKPSKTR